MEAILLCLLLNKLHFFSLTKNRFIVIQIIAFTCVLHVLACTLAILRHDTTKILQGRYNKILRAPFFTFAVFYYLKT